MKLSDKVEMLHGAIIAGKYVGNMRGNKALGIPPLNLNDGPQGFRSSAGTLIASPLNTTGTTLHDDEPKLLYMNMTAAAKRVKSEHPPKTSRYSRTSAESFPIIFYDRSLCMDLDRSTVCALVFSRLNIVLSELFPSGQTLLCLQAEQHVGHLE